MIMRGSACSSGAALPRKSSYVLSRRDMPQNKEKRKRKEGKGKKRKGKEKREEWKRRKGERKNREVHFFGDHLEWR